MRCSSWKVSKSPTQRSGPYGRSELRVSGVSSRFLPPRAVGCITTEAEPRATRTCTWKKSTETHVRETRTRRPRQVRFQLSLAHIFYFFSPSFGLSVSRVPRGLLSMEDVTLRREALREPRTPLPTVNIRVRPEWRDVTGWNGQWKRRRSCEIVQEIRLSCSISRHINFNKIVPRGTLAKRFYMQS